MPEAIQERHQKKCATNAKQGARCNCQRSYRASVFDPRIEKNLYSGWRKDRAEVQKWRTQAMRELSEGTRPNGDGPVLGDEWEAFYDLAASGRISNGRSKRYKPRTLESYKSAWDN